MREAPDATAASTTHGTGPTAAVTAPASLSAVNAITFLNSLGSGLLWSGVYFITEQSFQWTKAQNFMLALASTIVYSVAAFASGRVVAAIDHRFSARRFLALLMVIQMAGGIVVFFGAWGVVICALTASGAGAMLWPIMESYLSSGRHGHALRRAIGIFNLVWMGAVALGLLLIAPVLAAGRAELGMLLFVPISAVSLALLRWMPSRPPPHGTHGDEAHDCDADARRMPRHRQRPEQERALRDATRVLLPVGYILIGAIGPALPFLLGQLQVEPGWSTPVAATWMTARLVTVALLIRFTFWHGRAAALIFGFALAAGGFATIALAGSLPAMLAGLACFGAGQAIIYYAALYYAMAVGSAEVHAGGIFETLIGLGYGVGPIVGLAVGSGQAYVWGVLAISVTITALAFARVAMVRLRAA